MRARFLLLFAALALVLFFRLDQTPVVRLAETRVSDVAQNMLDSGDWVVPWRRGEPWLNKPPLYYWSSALVGKVRGTYDGWALRVPAALSALALLVLVLCWGRTLWGDAHGLLAALLWALSTEVVDHGRQGVAEMTLSLCVGLSWFAFSKLHATRDRRWYPAFAVAFALAILAKATVAVMLVLLPIAVFLVHERGWRDAMRPRPLAWTAAALAAGFAWYGVIVWRLPSAFDHFFKAAVLPAGVESEVGATHYKPVWGHLESIGAAGLPMTVLLPLPVVAAWRSRLWRGDPARRFVAWTFLASFVAFSLLPQKRRVYMLPLLLPLALLTADAVLATIAAAGRAEGRLRRFVGYGTLAVGVVVAVAVAGWYGWVLEGSRALALAAGLAPLAAGVLGLRAATGGRWSTAAAAFGVTWGTMLFVGAGSFDLLRTQVRTGAIECRLDHDPARWERAFDRFPFLRRKFRDDADQRGIFFGDAGPHPGCGHPPVLPPLKERHGPPE